LIWVNNMQSYGTTDYYVQKLFSTNKGTNVVTALRDGKALTGQDSLYVSAVIDKNTNDVIIKVVNASGTEQTNTIKMDGTKKLASQAIVTTLKSNDLNSENSFAKPFNVAPVNSSVVVKGKQIIFTSAPYSFSVIRVKM
jgi:alpha-L-arabinofuranosidase